MLRTSGFVDDIMLLYSEPNRPESNTMHMCHRVRQAVAPGAKSAGSDCILFGVQVLIRVYKNIDIIHTANTDLA